MTEEIKRTEFVMPKKSFKVEFYVGIFFLLGILCFAYLGINLAKLSLYNSRSYEVQASFSSVSGLKSGASVEIAGVAIGKISDIKLNSTQAVVTMQIDEGVKIRDEDNAAVRTKGIIGERYIKIVPGDSSAAEVKAGEELGMTESAVDLEEMIGKIIHRME